MSNRAPWFLLLVLALALAAGLTQILLLRFGRGDIYPPYSAFRTDPLGARILHDSLAKQPGLEVSRWHAPLKELKTEPAPALFFIGSGTRGWDVRADRNAETFRTLLAAGGNVIVAMLPITDASITNDYERFEYTYDDDDEAEPDDSKTKKKKPAKKKKSETTNEPPIEATTNNPAIEVSTNEIASANSTNKNRRLRFSSAKFTDWGYAISIDWSTNYHTQTHMARRAPGADASLPNRIPLHTRAWFSSNSPAWKTLYTHNDRPVAITRDFGPGTLTVFADAYPFSNEAMLKDRLPELISHLVGDRTRIVFDESHLGIAIENGFGDLARKYGLQGLLIALILLAALYIWTASAPLLPRRAAAGRDVHIAGRDSATGLVNLLRRNLTPTTLLDECFAAWNASQPATAPQRDAIQKIIATENARPAKERDPVATYRAIARALSKTSSDRKTTPPSLPTTGKTPPSLPG